MMKQVSKQLVLQEEDGIRDLVRSRGLGDVYKRQTLHRLLGDLKKAMPQAALYEYEALSRDGMNAAATVSYTHLTLPTSDLV